MEMPRKQKQTQNAEKIAASATYVLSPRLEVRLSSKAAIVMKVDNDNLAIEHPMLPCLAPFVEPSSVAKAYAKVKDVFDFDGIESYIDFLRPLVSRQVLVAPPKPEKERFILDYLSPELQKPNTWARISVELKRGRCVVLRDAFQPAFAKTMYECLDDYDQWVQYEDLTQVNFSFHHHNIYDRESYPEALRRCESIFGSRATKQFISDKTGEDCLGPITFSASRYMAGDYSLPHEDARFDRTVSFVWHLSRDWDPSWGGALYWVPRAIYLPATFNSLVLFNVSTESSSHFVTHVNSRCTGKRLAINGWWNHPADSPRAKQTVGRKDGPEKIGAKVEVY
jgi:Rps23 Pro-64 3,4-dihydroxylase Tpa1-like proline 4-hydroxylase